MAVDEAGRVASIVAPGESVVWTSHAPRGFRLRQADILLIPLSFLYCGAVARWLAFLITRDIPLLFILWAIPFACVGLYLLAGRFWLDIVLRRNTVYALTDRAAYIARFGLSPKVRRFVGSTLQEATYVPLQNGAATITFASESFFSYSPFRQWSNARLDAFEDVSDGRRVYDMVLGIGRTA